ncbi:MULTISPECIES: transcription antitermination factor NusB [Methylobacterium]|jgi:transcription antitermination protein NusB|uniref:transcription antitermination factor NusB n=1 Tax=Methylobacterium TaxID=407 RepID=UPI000345AC86|nr:MULTISPECIES: transcription antitermination factor NusB [Methylobacterium]MBN4092725.1 transcription antitermination factor NusB [Methylobacterium sp. OT2]SEG47355.1 NusB antitermination factor [Methylobacterium sp. 190mf]SEO90619.1 NusB antitermination factor [Methylobacterium sp. UNC300MFChir4.1]SFE72857.1 NusB antitermination factor [Methylobacterium sp. 13MFTsu3.1M2]SFT07874.1 NusB antitermination factor [Methylobacterium sp. yr668]
MTGTPETQPETGAENGTGTAGAPAKISLRSGARLAVVQALYEMDVSGKGVLDALAEFEAFWIGQEVDGIAHPPAETAFFRDLLRGTVEEQRAIDPKLDQALAQGWPLRRIEIVLRAILRAGAYELMFRRDVPAAAAISEYVDVAHSFYTADEPGLVNAVLDRVAREVRPGEVGAPKASGKPGSSKPLPGKAAAGKPSAGKA